MAGASGKVFSITELRRTGAGRLEDTPVVFRWDAASRSMPENIIETPLVVKTHRTELPGADEPVEHVMSVAWQPFELSGQWKDRWAGRGFAMSMYREFGRLVARGSLVRIQFSQLSYVGLITDYTPGYRRDDWVTYQFTFSPHQNETIGSTRLKRVVQVQARPIIDHVGQAQAINAEIAAQQEAAREIALASSLREDLGIDLLALSGVIDRAADAGGHSLETDATQKLLAVGALFRSVRGAAQSVTQRVAKVRSDAHVALDDVIQTLRFDEWTRTTASDARRTMFQSWQAERDMETRARAKPRAIHRARQGESLERIGLRYGVPWRLIYDANGLSSYVLNGTEELVIPEVSP